MHFSVFKILLKYYIFIGGWNNNPTALQLKYVFKRLVATRFDSLPSRNGNVRSDIATNDTSTVSSILLEHPYQQQGQDLPVIAEPIIGHIAGMY